VIEYIATTAITLT